MGKKKVLFAGVLAAVFATSAGALVACSDEVEAPAGNDGVHAVTFDANGGTFKDGKTVKINTDKDGKIVTEPTAPTYADHTFKGYTVTKDGDSILTLGANGYKFTADQTIYAKWEANTPAAEDIVITFNVGENGTMTGATTAKAVNGKLASLPTVTAKTGWTWEGWYTAATAGEKVTTATVFTKSATIYAQYKAEVVVTEEATITLDVGAGTLPTGVANTLKTVNGKLASLPTPTAPEGKKFDGWYTKATDGTKVTTSTVFEADGTIYAVYKDQSEEDEEFTITFDVGAHGTLKDEETSAETLDGMLVELPEVEPAEGWYFKGWFDKATGGEKVTDETVFEADATIYAVYAAAPCVKVGEKNIYLNENTEGLMPGQLAEYMILKVELEVNDTLTFMMMDEESGEYVAYPVYIQGDCKGIDVSVTSSKVNSATVLRAGEYDIYIKLWTSATDKNNWAFYATDGGSIIREEQNLTEGALYAVGGMNDWQLKEAFEIKENKLVLDLLADQELLVGAWKQGEEKPEMDWDTAKYDYNKLDTASQAIVGDANGNVKILEEGKYIITIVSTTEWKIEKVAEEPPVVVEYTITFNAGEGTCATASAETVDGKLTGRPTPTAPEGYRFVGWYLSEDEDAARVTDATVFTEDATIYARYEEETPEETEYTITFNAGEGTCATASAETVDGKLDSLPTVTAPDGYEFIGWYTAAENGDQVTTEYEFTESKEIYALYEAKLTIMFDAGDGTCATTEAKTTAKKLTALPTPTAQTNYKFDGWYTAETGGEKVTTATVFEASQTVYARYTKMDGVWVGNTRYALVLNGGQSLYKNEWWFGNEVKKSFTAEQEVQVYVNGKLVSGFISSSSVGIEIPSTDTAYDNFKITTTGDFAVYVRENADGTWGVQFAGPTQVNTGDELPEGDPAMLNCTNGKIRLYLEYNGTAITTDGTGNNKLSTYKIWAWNGGTNLTGGTWPGRTLGETVSITGNMTSSTNFIISGSFGQTSDLDGMEATQAGNTYQLKINKVNNTITTELIKIDVPIESN